MSEDKKPEFVILILEEMEHSPDCPEHPDYVSRSKGPSAVATDAYRAGWQNIFGRKTVVGKA